MVKNKITNEYVVNYVYDYGYRLIDFYEHAHTRITLECPNNHVSTYLFREFKKGKRCSECKKEIKQENRILKFKTFVETNSKYTFLELIGTREIKLQCEYGHVYNVIWDSFKKGHRCPKCANCMKYSYEEVKDFIENENYILISDTYINANTPLKLLCPNDHEYSTVFNSFRLGNRCQICYLGNNTGANSSNWKGGITPLHNYMREKINQWKIDSLRKYEYKCVITQIKSPDLIVHHLYGFSAILIETLEELKIIRKRKINEYTDTELSLIEELLLQKHYVYGLGVPLLPEIHEAFHSTYGYGNNTKEQFEDFAANYFGDCKISV